MLLRQLINNQVWAYAMVVSAAVLSPSVSAYQFGPPPITELAEAGGSQSRFNVYSQKQTVEKSKLEADLTGISLANSTGDSIGASSSMFRVARYTDNRVTTGSSGVLLGAGGGGQWYFGEERAFGVLLNGQMDLLVFNYKPTIHNQAVTQGAIGVEFGGLYRIFIEKATITPFISFMKGVRTRFDSCSSTSNLCNDRKFIYTDSARTIGLDFMMGVFSASILNTKASDNFTLTNERTGASLPSGNTSTTTTMLIIGYNF